MYFICCSASRLYLKFGWIFVFPIVCLHTVPVDSNRSASGTGDGQIKTECAHRRNDWRTLCGNQKQWCVCHGRSLSYGLCCGDKIDGEIGKYISAPIFIRFILLSLLLWFCHGGVLFILNWYVCVCVARLIFIVDFVNTKKVNLFRC